MKPFRTSWTQFQGDSDNSGYAALRTGTFTNERYGPPNAPAAGGGSPIVDPLKGTEPLDYALYLTDAVGQLSKYRALNGEVLWTRAGGSNVQWGSTPAIDNAGRVYALFSNLMDSVLVCFNRDGDELWRWVPPGPSVPDYRTLLFGSPKVWNQSDGGALIFLTLAYLNFPLDRQWTLLIAFNHEGRALANVWFSTSFIYTAHGSGGLPFFNPRVLPVTHQHPPFVDVEQDLADKPVVGPGQAALTQLPNQRLWEPTCAVVDGDAPDFPTVITTDGIATVAAFRWFGHGGLQLLWKKYPSRDGFPRLTPPAVLPNGLVAIGCSDGDVKLLDPASGAFLKPWPDLDAPIVGTPASFLRQIYVTTLKGDVAMVDSNGILKTKVNVGAQIASSALVTATNVYVTAANGIYAFDLFLNKLHTYAISPAGVSSFAVGPDGSLYVVAEDRLRAFSPPA